MSMKKQIIFLQAIRESLLKLQKANFLKIFKDDKKVLRIFFCN